MAAAPTNPPGKQCSASASDAELVRALKEKQVRALGLLYDRHARMVFGVALKVLGNSEDAEDLTQEIFLQLWRRPGVYNPARGALPSYLATLTRSRAIDVLRSRTSKFKGLQRWRQLFFTESPAESPLETALGGERAGAVREALSQLPPRQRDILQLRFYGNCSFSEIARRLDLPLGTVKTRSRQGLIALRTQLAALTPPSDRE